MYFQSMSFMNCRYISQFSEGSWARIECSPLFPHRLYIERREYTDTNFVLLVADLVLQVKDCKVGEPIGFQDMKTLDTSFLP